jgi:hypothetical protein
MKYKIESKPDGDTPRTALGSKKHQNIRTNKLTGEIFSLVLQNDALNIKIIIDVTKLIGIFLR